MASRTRKAEGFNLSFIDVMSCGLGAVILVLILVEYKTELPDEQLNALIVELAQAQDQTKTQGQSVAELQQQAAARSEDLRASISRLQDIRNNTAAQEALNESLKKLVDSLQQKVASKTPEPDPVPVSGKRHENYLLGLKVEGRRIVFLIDSSASMADERLIDIIRYKVSSRAARSKAPKWKRTRRVAEWLVARVPVTSEYMMIRFADKAKVVGGPGWKKGGDAADAALVKSALAKAVPEGGTDLENAVNAMHRKAGGFTDVYVVTDGLPTQGRVKGGKKIASLFSGCVSIIGRATSISGECRSRLLRKVVSDYKAKAKVNVILLPIEGDPLASYAFWRWTSSTGGLLISPETSWP